MIIVTTSNFEKSSKKILKNNKPLASQLSKCLKLLKTNPNHPSLRLHKLVGNNIYSISVNMSIRILIHFYEGKIFLLKMGDHKEVY